GIYVGGLLVDSIGWRWTFVALGAPGIVLALLVLVTIREPARGALDDPSDAALRNAGDIPLLAGVKTLWASPTFRVMSYSAALSSLCGYGMNLWMPQFMSRIHGLSPAEFSLALGAMMGAGGGLGAMLGGALTGRAAERDPRAFLTLPGATMVLFAVAMVFALWTSSVAVVYASI